MAIQFRTRTKSTIDYSGDLKSTGVCCDFLGNKTSKTLVECFQSGGNFQYGDIDTITCPQPGTIGCCCSCNSSFLDIEGSSVGCGNPITYSTTGLTPTTQCECDRLGGKWSNIQCPTTATMNDSQARSLCIKSYPANELSSSCTTLDARIPRSCCYMERNEANVPTGIVCKNVCKSSDCLGYTLSNEPAIYSKNKLCEGSLLGNGVANCGSSNFASLMTTKSTLFEGFEHGSCYSLNKTNSTYSYNCNFSIKSDCSEYWVPMRTDMKVCNHIYAPQTPTKIGSRLIEPETMSETKFDSLDLPIGEFYKGGFYIGKFEPGSPITPRGSSIYGSSQVSFAKNYFSEAIGPGDKSNNKWALVVEPATYITRFLDTDERFQTNYTNLSNYDGFYNFYGDNKQFNGIKTKLSNTIAGKNRKGFVDFYLPSIKELQFFAYQYKKYTGAFEEHIAPIGAFMTSTMKTDKLIYCQYMSIADSSNYGRMILSSVNTRVSMLFFRRILLT